MPVIPKFVKGLFVVGVPNPVPNAGFVAVVVTGGTGVVVGGIALPNGEGVTFAFPNPWKPPKPVFVVGLAAVGVVGTDVAGEENPVLLKPVREELPKPVLKLGAATGGFAAVNGADVPLKVNPDKGLAGGVP